MIENDLKPRVEAAMVYTEYAFKLLEAAKGILTEVHTELNEDKQMSFEEIMAKVQNGETVVVK